MCVGSTGGCTRRHNCRLQQRWSQRSNVPVVAIVLLFGINAVVVLVYKVFMYTRFTCWIRRYHVWKRQLPLEWNQCDPCGTAVAIVGITCSCFNSRTPWGGNALLLEPARATAGPSNQVRESSRALVSCSTNATIECKQCTQHETDSGEKLRHKDTRV